MTTQYTTILKLALPVQGELSGTWGDVVNDNITQMVEQAIAGKATINSWTANAHTLTTADGTTSESRCAILELTDTGTALTGAGTVTCPTNTKLYIVDNNTAQIITVKTSGGTGVAVPVGKTMLVYCDGTNVVEGVTHANSLSLGTSTVTVDSVLDQDDMSSDSATALATQQSIKAYVDSQVGTVDTLAEILANGNTTGGTDIAVGTGDDITFADSSKAIFGAGSDLQIYHDGSHSYIKDTATGNLRLDGTDIQIRSDTGANMAAFVSGAEVQLYHNNQKKLDTTSTGIDVTGTATMDGLTVSSDSGGPVYLQDSNATATYNISELSNNAGNFNVQTRDSSGTFVSTDYQIVKNASGADYQRWFTQGSERMRLDANGNVGIGTSSPSSVLSVKSDVNNNVNNGILFEAADSTNKLLQLYENSVGECYMGFYQADVQTALIRTNGNSYFNGGNVGIGTTSPSALVHLTADNPTLRFEDNAGGASSDYEIEVSSSLMQFKNVTNATTDMTINNTGNVGIGTASPATKLHVENDASTYEIMRVGSSTVTHDTGLYMRTTGTAGISWGTGGVLAFYGSGAGAAERMRIDASGNVGVGTTSPDYAGFAETVLTIASTTSNTQATLEIVGNQTSSNTFVSGISFHNESSTATGKRIGQIWTERADSDNDAGNLAFATATTGGVLTEAMRIDSSGNVGIGAAPANGRLHVTAASGVVGWFETTGLSGALGISNSGTFGMQIDTASSSGFLTFTKGSGTTEFGRFDTSGNLLVGTTSTSIPNQSSNTGIFLFGGGSINVARSGSECAIFNRITSDGEIVRIQKDGTTVGSIGTVSGLLGIGSGDAILAFDGSGNAMYPMSSQTGGVSDGVLDFGSNLRRWKDLYLSGGAYLGGTAAANKLDDYEEGTFSGTVDGTTYSGEYTKVGNLVTISCYYDCSAATNNRIAIVPFACSGVVSTQNSGAGITASTSATHPEGTSACVFNTTANVYAYSYARATLGTPSTGNGNFQFTYYTTE